jgi:hypothetical protein
VLLFGQRRLGSGTLYTPTVACGRIVGKAFESPGSYGASLGSGVQHWAVLPAGGGLGTPFGRRSGGWQSEKRDEEYRLLVFSP